LPYRTNMQNASLTEPVPPQALSSVALSSSICNSGDSTNEDKSTIDLRNGRTAGSPFLDRWIRGHSVVTKRLVGIPPAACGRTELGPREMSWTAICPVAKRRTHHEVPTHGAEGGDDKVTTNLQ
jgi:hypothetical protein